MAGAGGTQARRVATLTQLAGGRGGASTATDRAYAAIRRAIVTGTYETGRALREEELAEAAGVSRTPVREALRRLSAEGLVDLLPHRGATVAAWSGRDLDEIFELRAQLESYGARLAAERVTPVEMGALRQLEDQMEAEVAGNRRGRLQRISEINNEFHQGLLTAGGNRRLAAMVATVVQRALVERTFHLYRPDQLERSCRHHREILEALEARDPQWAEAIMRTHILAGRRVASEGAP